ncbi:MAG: lipid-binding SYLF domain-containing protein [Candidatus Aminicenantes bacterium]|nr:MAG: lipid-binding SYLF domain-containing protein [Candidatus Aminicenantes bacterium]
MISIPSCLIIQEREREGSPASEIKRVEDAIEVVYEIVDIPEEGMPTALLGKAYGIAVIPNVIKAAYGIGGRYGRGVLLVRTEEGDWSNPSFISLAGGSLGWQIGIQSADIILVFKNRKTIESISRGKFTLGADASVAAGPVGRHAEASTDIQLKAEIYSYSKSRGLFAGISIEGAALQIDHNANSDFYGRRYINPREIFWDREIEAPEIARELRRLLSQYTE